MTTASTIISGALGLIGVKAPGEAVSGNEAADCLARLNLILDGWKAQSLYAQAKVRVTGSVSAATATIGTASTFATTQPANIEDGFYTSGGVDYPIVTIGADEYNAIPFKTQTGLGPDRVYFERPGTLYFWPIPAAAVTVTLNVLSRLTDFADTETSYTLPVGVQRALTYTLAEEMAPDYRTPIPPSVAAFAISARKNLKRINASVPQLEVDHRIDWFTFYA